MDSKGLQDLPCVVSCCESCLSVMQVAAVVVVRQASSALMVVALICK